ncbi:MAG: hypothetical protein AB8B61_09160 [Cyclobacteriaceae bacterium]
MKDLDFDIDLEHTLLRFTNGIQYIIRKDGTFTGEMAKEIAETRLKKLNETSCPTLISTNGNFIDDSAKKYLQSDEFKEIHSASAVAMIANNRAKIMVLTVITSYMNLPCPIKIFKKIEDGEKWLKQFID